MHGNLFKLVERDGKAGRGTYTFTVSREKVNAVNNGISIKFYYYGSYNDGAYVSFDAKQLY